MARRVYTLNWLPIGGFVKLEGEDGTDPDDPRSFSHQGLPKKLTILIAGVVMNVLLAFVIFTGIAWLASPLVGVRFFEVQPDSPAAAAGLQPGEAIVAVNGEHYQFITGPNAITGLRDRAGETITLTIADTAGAQRDVSVTLRTQAEIDAQKGALGHLRRGQALRGLLLRAVRDQRPAAPRSRSGSTRRSAGWG